MIPPKGIQYSIETLCLDCKEYVLKYQNVEQFLSLCRKCGNYGKLYTCPPFDEERYSLLNEYKTLELVIMRVSPGDLEQYFRAREYFDALLLSKESERNGSLALFAGSCIVCDAGCCGRPSGRGCFHKERSRLSLEALGFDVTATLSDFFQIELEWAEDGKQIGQMVLLGALVADKFVV